MTGSKKSIFVVVSLLALVVLGGTIYILCYDFFSNSNPTENTTENQNDTSGKPYLGIKGVSAPENITKDQVTVNSLLKSQLPNVSNASAVSISSLPKDLTFLVPKAASSVVVKSAKFAGGESGYEITFSYPDEMAQVHSDFGGFVFSAKYKLLSGARAENYSSHVAENDIYKLQLDFTRVDEKTTSVKIFVIKK